MVVILSAIARLERVETDLGGVVVVGAGVEEV